MSQEADRPSHQCQTIAQEGSLAWGNRCILQHEHAGAHVYGAPKYERGNPKIIKFRRPYTWHSLAIDCLHCKKSWLMDVDTTMTAVFCPYCAGDMETDWE